MKRLKIILVFYFIVFSIKVFSQFAGGSGTENDPYLIATAQQFNQIRNQASETTVYYKLISDINLDDLGVGSGGNWTPIGISARVSIDGNGYTIRNMKIYLDIGSDNEIGLFRPPTSLRIFNLVCKNFEIVDSTLNNNLSNSNIAFLTSKFGASYSYFRNLIYKVIVDSSKIILKEDYSYFQNDVGGIIGEFSNVAQDTIKECAVNNTLIFTQSNSTTGGYSTGAVLGKITEGVVQKSFANNVEIKGRSSTTTSGAIGAFVGQVGYSASTSGNVVIENCYFKGTITLTTTSGGGVVGFAAGIGYTGGSPNLIIRKCYSVATSSGPSGGYVKRGWTGVSQNVTYSYFNYETIEVQRSASSYVNNDTAVAKSTLEMKNQSTYVTWDFENIWGISSLINDGYPYLKWTPVPVYDTLTFISPSQNSIVKQNDTVKLVWKSPRDSATLFVSFLTDSINVYNDTTYYLPLPDSFKMFNITIVGKPLIYNPPESQTIHVPVSDTLHLLYLPNRFIEIDSLYINIYTNSSANSGNFQRDLNSFLSSMRMDSVLHVKILSYGVDTLDLMFMTSDSTLYYLGTYKVQDTVQIPNSTVLEVPLNTLKFISWDVCGSLVTKEKSSFIPNSNVITGGSSIQKFSSSSISSGGSAKAGGSIHGLLYKLDIDVIEHLTIIRHKFDQNELKITPSPCGAYFCCWFSGSIFAGIRYVDLSCGWSPGPTRGFKQVGNRAIGMGYNSSGHPIDLPYVWVEAYRADPIIQEEIHIDVNDSIKWYTFKMEWKLRGDFSWDWSDISNATSKNEVFETFNYQVTPYSQYGIFKFSVNENKQLVTEINLPEGVRTIIVPLEELNSFVFPLDVRFEVINDKPLLLIQDSQGKFLILLLDDFFALSSKEVIKLVNPAIEIKNISYNIVANQSVSSDVLNYVQNEISNCNFLIGKQNNYFRGIHPKIWKYGNEQGIKQQ